MMKRFCCTLLCLVMLLCALSVTAYGEVTIDRVSLSVKNYKFGEATTNVTATKNKDSASFDVVGVTLTDSAVTEETNITTPTACGDERFKANKDYWLVIKLKAHDGYTFNGLTMDDVYISDHSGASVLKLEGADNTVAYAAFKLNRLTARFSTIKYYRVGAKITDTYLNSTPSWVVGDVKISFSESPVADNKWEENVITDSAATFQSDTNYYLRLTFKSTTELEQNDVQVKCRGLQKELTANALYHNEGAGEYYAQFMLPKLTGELVFTLQNYQLSKKANEMSLSMTGDTDGVDFTGNYSTTAAYNGFFLASSLEKLYDYNGNTIGGFLGQEGVVSGATQLCDKMYYYLLIGLKAKEGYDIGYLADVSVLTLKVGDDYTYIEDPEEVSVIRWNKEIEDCVFFAFKLPMLGAERVNRVDATVREPVVGEPVDQTPALLVTTNQKTYSFVGLGNHVLGDLVINGEWRKIAAEDYTGDTEYNDWMEVESGERFEAGYYYMFIVSAGEDMDKEDLTGTHELSPAVIGAINNGGEYEFVRSNYMVGDYLSVTRVFEPLEAPQEEQQVGHEPIRRQNTTTTTTTDTAKTDTTKADTVTSAKTFDVGTAVYGLLAVTSLLGMGYVGKKR